MTSNQPDQSSSSHDTPVLNRQAPDWYVAKLARELKAAGEEAGNEEPPLDVIEMVVRQSLEDVDCRDRSTRGGAWQRRRVMKGRQMVSYDSLIDCNNSDGD